MISNDVLQYLKDNLFIVFLDGKNIITNKFKRELGISSNSTKSIIVKPVIIPLLDIKEIYKKFIIDAKVPSKLPTHNGKFFWANRFSEDGLKAFSKIYNNQSIDKAVLLRSTQWYYAQENTARKMIGNYFSEGIWESGYDDFIKALAENKIIPPDEDKDKGRNSLRL